MRVLKVNVISLPYIFQILYVLCFARPRYQVSVYRTNGPLVLSFRSMWFSLPLGALDRLHRLTVELL